MMHPFDPNKLLVWSLVAGKWHVLIGGHTIRVRKELIKNRLDDNNNNWEGWVSYPINYLFSCFFILVIYFVFI